MTIDLDGGTHGIKGVSEGRRRPRNCTFFDQFWTAKGLDRWVGKCSTAAGKVGHLSVLHKKSHIVLDKVLNKMSILLSLRSNLQHPELRLSIWTNHFAISYWAGRIKLVTWGSWLQTLVCFKQYQYHATIFFSLLFYLLISSFQFVLVWSSLSARA